MFNNVPPQPIPMSPSSSAPQAPVFVVGFYRSGTSLLHALLNQHPAISLMYECDVLKLWPTVRTRSRRADWPERLEFWNGTLSRHRLETGAWTAGARNRCEVAQTLYRAFALKKGASLHGEKSPYYHDHLPALAADFPASKIIVLWRSPAEILRSIRRAGRSERFFARTDWVDRLIVGTKKMSAGCAQLRAAGHPLHEIHYQTLVSQPKETLKGICRFLEISFDERMTDLSDADTSALPSGEHHAGVRQGRVVAGTPSHEILSEKDLRALREGCEPWPNAAPGGGGLRLPPLSFSERSQDLYFRGRDAFIRLVYACCPIALLQSWRQRRQQSFTANAELRTPPALK